MIGFYVSRRLGKVLLLLFFACPIFIVRIASRAKKLSSSSFFLSVHARRRRNPRPLARRLFSLEDDVHRERPGADALQRLCANGGRSWRERRLCVPAPSAGSRPSTCADSGPAPLDALGHKQRGNVVATQFHPEKSQELGLAMLRNFISSL